MFAIKYRKIFYSFSGILVALSIFAIGFFGIKFGIDFTGGSVLEFRYNENKLDKNQVQEVINSTNMNLGDYSLREISDNGYILRTRTISGEEKNVIMNALNSNKNVSEVRFNNVGPTLGKELQSKAIVSIIIVIIAIVLFVAYAFRHVSKPVSSWNYGLITIITFFHDVIIPIGLFAFLGQFYGVEVDTLFIIAILVVLGYSINDTIVVFDRIRERLGMIEDDDKREKEFEKTVSESLVSTIGRSINTSLTTVLALLAIYFIGGEVTKSFSLAMIVGVVAGTYSSIFLSAPLLITIFKKKKDKTPDTK